MPAVTISVIIPAHNRAHTLPRALDSVLAQTHPADEIILVDDGSSDDTAALLHTHYPTVRYLHQPNQGVSAARNSGIRVASGDWIALLDSDDAWLPHKLACQARQLDSGAPLIHSDEIWIRNGVRVNPMKKHAKSGGWIYQQCLPLCAISPSAALLRRDLFQHIGLFDDSLPACEDYDFWLRVCARHPVVYIDEPLILKYGGHADQLSRRYWGMDRFRVQALEKALREAPLNSADRLATLQMLTQKLTILAQGAYKRGKHNEAADYRQRLQRYQQQLSDSSADPLCN
ncbi:MAG: glycosyltransferase family A protein [Gammaproteobacteria bacterium]